MQGSLALCLVATSPGFGWQILYLWESRPPCEPYRWMCCALSFQWPLMLLSSLLPQVHANLARDMIEKAKEKDVFLTEGLWSRFFPATQKCALAPA